MYTEWVSSNLNHNTCYARPQRQNFCQVCWSVYILMKLKSGFLFTKKYFSRIAVFEWNQICQHCSQYIYQISVAILVPIRNAKWLPVEIRSYQQTIAIRKNSTADIMSWLTAPRWQMIWGCFRSFALHRIRVLPDLMMDTLNETKYFNTVLNTFTK
jgi:hypothetical protein